MAQQVSTSNNNNKIEALIKILIDRLRDQEESLNNLKETIQAKLNPEKKEFLNDEDLFKIFGITQNIKYRMLREGTLRQYKLTGKNSTSLYKYDEIVEQIEKNFNDKYLSHAK